MKSCLLITTWNRTALLERSLIHLHSPACNFTLPDEILVIDDGGSDNCEEMVRNLPFPVRYIYTHHPGQSICSHARNVGLWNTDAELIITCEPEILFNSDVIAQLLADHAERPNEMISVGYVRHDQGDGTTIPTVGYVATWCALYRRSWLLDIGGWDEDFPDPWGWDDVDLCTRLRCAGHGQHIDQAIEVTHQWHGPTYCDQDRNEAHFRAKILDSGSEVRDEDIVANRTHDWGVIKSR